MSVVLKAAVAYWILLISVRLIGRRSVSMMAPFDLIVLFLFGGATLNSVLGQDHSVVAAYSAICTIGLMHLFVSWLKVKSDFFGRLVDGTPVVIYHAGVWEERRMRQLRIERQDVLAAMRQSGLFEIGQIRYAVAERDGKVSIVPDRQ
jgi:uncharacterized membrane protein YcaP (DUF421 family)